MNHKQRTAFFISDRTGLTAEVLGRSLLSQFEGIEFHRVTLRYIDTPEKARDAVARNIPHEMLLLDLYSALRPIDAITGATTADDILNRIFSTFCIGK